MATFSSNSPIYIQVMDEIKTEILNGTLKPGDKIESVRELARKYSINPNTIQRALGELEREGFIYTERAVGKFVSENKEIIFKAKDAEVQALIKDFMKQMAQLQVDKEDVITMIKEGNYESY